MFEAIAEQAHMIAGFDGRDQRGQGKALLAFTIAR